MNRVEPGEESRVSVRVGASEVPVRAVLVAYDFSEASDKALLHGMAIARHFRAKFYLAHIVSSLGYTIAGPQTLKMAVEANHREMQKLKECLEGKGALTGVEHEFLVREGNVWEELQRVIQEKQIDAVVIGTHARRGLGKLLLGSVAEQIFRNAKCFVVTVGPGASGDSLVEKVEPVGPFLFATDFGPASQHGVPSALSFADHFGSKLVLLHVLPAAPIPAGFHWSKTGDLQQMREEAEKACERRLAELIPESCPATMKPKVLVKFGIPSEQILLAAHELKADLIVLGLNRSAHTEAVSHTPWAAAYRVVCGARCPVLTVRN